MSRCRIDRRDMPPAWLGVAVTVVGLLGAGVTAAATAEEVQLVQAQLLRVTTLEIEPGKQRLFDEFAADLRAAYVEQGGGLGWQVASTEIGEGILYTLVQPFTDWAQLAPDVRAPVLAEMAGFDTVVIGQNVAVYRYLPEYSREPPADVAAATLRVTVRIELRPSRVDDYLAALALVREARIRAGSPAFWGVYSGSIGASNRLVMVFPMADWNVLNDPPGPVRSQLVAAFGEAQAEKTMATMEAAEIRVESRLMRLRPELSYAPEN